MFIGKKFSYVAMSMFLLFPLCRVLITVLYYCRYGRINCLIYIPYRAYLLFKLVHKLTYL